MPKKEDLINSIPGNAVGSDFDRQDDILNFRPVIEFIEPDIDAFEGTDETTNFDKDDDPETIDSLRQRTRDLINTYDSVKKLAKIAQARIDKRVAAAGGEVLGSSISAAGAGDQAKTATGGVATGGVEIKLDPVVDASTIAAMKRHFPNRADPTKITYNDYRKCLQDLSASGPELPTVLDSDIKAAKSDPLRTDFGGLSNRSGENRPEISSAANSVSPLDLSALQAALIIALFAALLPMIKLEDKAEIALHLVTIPHVP